MLRSAFVWLLSNFIQVLSCIHSKASARSQCILMKLVGAILLLLIIQPLTSVFSQNVFAGLTYSYVKGAISQTIVHQPQFTIDNKTNTKLPYFPPDLDFPPEPK